MRWGGVEKKKKKKKKKSTIVGLSHLSCFHFSGFFFSRIKFNDLHIALFSLIISA